MAKEKKKTVGRPSIPAEERRTKQVTVRLSSNELRQLKNAALADHDRTVAEVAREMIVKASARRSKATKHLCDT